MPCRPASIRIMWKPKYFHEMITNIVIITKLGSPNQSWTRTPRPTADRPQSTNACGWRSSRNTIPVTASDSTYGRKNSSRNMARPRNRRLSMTASASENGIWIASDRTMTSTLLPIAARKTSLDSATW